MRVVSQDGTIDTPYELSMIWIREKYGYSVMTNMPNDDPVGLGMYSSREKAIKAMEMLKSAYENNMFYHCMANRKGYVEAQSALGAEQFQKATTEYFQFPQDDEIEV